MSRSSLKRIKEVRRNHNVSLLEAKQILDFQNLKDDISRLKIDPYLRDVLDQIVDILEKK